MRVWIRGVAVLLAVAAFTGDVRAEPDCSYRARVSFEVQGARTNSASPLVQAGAAPCAASTRGVAVPLAVAAFAGDVRAEPDWSYRARVSFEVQGARTNRSSPLVQAGAAPWDASNLFVAAADSTWESGRLKLAGGLVAVG